MYADRLEEEARSVRTRLSGDGAPAAEPRPVGGVRSKISFKRTANAGGARGRGRSSLDEKWKHDLFDDSDHFLTPQGNGTDLRAVLESKRGPAKGGRLSGRVGTGGLMSARAAVAAAAELAQNPSGGATWRAGRASAGAVRRSTAGVATRRASAGVLRAEQEEEEEGGAFGRGPGSAVVANSGPAVVRGGRGSMIVRAQVDDGMDMDEEAMPGQPPLVPRKSAAGVPLNVAGFLSSLGLAKYQATFQAEEIDMPTLLHMTDEDLKELGIPMGPRKKILQAAAAM